MQSLILIACILATLYYLYIILGLSDIRRERKKLGYKSVEDYHKGGGYEDAETNLCRLLSKELKEVLLDQEVN